MVQLITIHEFVDACNRKCVTQKDRCVRYNSAKEYLTTMETRHEHRKDMFACEAPPNKPIQL